MIVVTGTTVGDLISTVMLKEFSKNYGKRFTVKSHYNDLELVTNELLEFYMGDREFCWIVGVNLDLKTIRFLSRTSKAYPDMKFIVVSNYSNKNMTPLEMYMKSKKSNVKFLHDITKEPVEIILDFLKRKGRIDTGKYLSLVRMSSDYSSVEYNVVSELISHKSMCELKDELSDGFIPDSVYKYGASLLDKEKENVKQRYKNGDIQIDGNIVYSISKHIGRLPYFLTKKHFINLDLEGFTLSILSEHDVDSIVDNSLVKELFKVEIFRVVYKNKKLVYIHFKKGIGHSIIVEASQMLLNVIKGK